MQQRIAAVQFQFAERDFGLILEGSQMRFVVGVFQEVAGPAACESAASPVRTPSGDRSWMTPSYSWRPLNSRTSATFRSHTARSRGDSSSIARPYRGLPCARGAVA